MFKEWLYNIAVKEEKSLLGFILKPGLFFLSFLYFLIIKLRLAVYKSGILPSARLKAPVISVGNITWGGTGKTPLVEAVSLYLLSQGKRVALLTRGYGSDEDKVIAENIPGASVFIGKNRLNNATLAENKIRPDIFILDDGFQHLRIKRDSDILTVNATDPFGNGLLIPAGILREPISHLSRAGLVVITKSDLISKEKLGKIKDIILKIKPDMDIFEACHQPVLLYKSGKDKIGLEYIKGRKICAVSGLGDNSSFEHTLKNIGANIGLKFFYMDHHKYTKKELNYIIEKCGQNNIGAVLTTEKDWIKIKGFLGDISGMEFITLKIKLKVKDEERFFGRLSSVFVG